MSARKPQEIMVTTIRTIMSVVHYVYISLLASRKKCCSEVCIELSDKESNWKEIQAANYPTRKTILSNLKKGSKTPDELTKASKVNKKIFEDHLKILLDLGLVKTADDKQINLTDRGKEILAYVEKLDMENIEWT